MYATDEEYNKRLREELRPDDPMYDYFMSKRLEKEEEEEGEIQELTLEDVGVPIVEGKEEEETAVRFTVIGNAEEDSTSEEEKPAPKEDASVSSKKHRSHRHHSKKEEKGEGERKHRRHHH